MVEADFLRFYGKDLGEEVFVRGTGCRRLLAWLVGLPGDAAVWREELAADLEGSDGQHSKPTNDPDAIRSFFARMGG